MSAVLLLLLAAVLKLVGTLFLFAAALGVLRFSDPFQRMHAATKAGTLGAGLVVVGSALTLGTVSAVVMGVLAALFLLFTIPVAGHLLGRAAYLSGASLEGSQGEDALQGVLDRADRPLEERLGREGPAGADRR